MAMLTPKSDIYGYRSCMKEGEVVGTSPNILIFDARQKHICFFEKIFDSEVVLDYFI